jgi:hypothetical protein
MDNETKMVLRGFFNLNSKQRNEFIDAVNRYHNGESQIKETIIRETKALDTGPSAFSNPSICGCCMRPR